MKKGMNRRHFLTTSAAAGLGALLRRKGFGTLGKMSRRPNVLLILADDLGYGDVSCYGCEDIKTPNIDRLAEQGVRFTDFYAAPVCTPTRCAIMTGRYQQRVEGLEWAIYPGVKRLGLSPSETTIATLLKRNGYTTGLFGKWHLGYKREFGPNNHGFDEFFGFLSGNINYFTHKEVNGEPDLYENTKPVDLKGYMTDLIGQRACRFLDQHHEKPFFLDVCFNAPHWPIQGPADSDRVVDESHWKEGTRETYVKMVERMDQNIGKILEKLDKYNLASHTLVIFASDNGGDTLSRNAPLSGKKTTLWEGGIRVPCILRSPGALQRGKAIDQMGIVMDLSATILAATGTKPPAGRPLDGLNLIPILNGILLPHHRTFFWRSKTQDACRSGLWKYLRDGEREYLFNIEDDSGEKGNFADKYPEKLNELKSLYKKWAAEMQPRPTIWGTH